MEKFPTEPKELTESKEFKKPTEEQLNRLHEAVSEIPDIFDQANIIKRQIEEIQHQAATGDNSPRHYEYLNELVQVLNEKLQKAPNSVSMEQPPKPEKIKPEDIEILSPTRPMMAEEVLKKMEELGLRPMTLEELKSSGEATKERARENDMEFLRDMMKAIKALNKETEKK